MDKYFTYRQNNSGGSWKGPAVNVIVEADTLAEANERVGQHITLCGDSGLYAEYDSCGCCPCCGHRWSEPWDDKPESGADAADGNMTLNYMGAACTALIKADGEMIVGDTQERLDAIGQILTPNAGVERPTTGGVK